MSPLADDLTALAARLGVPAERRGALAEVLAALRAPTQAARLVGVLAAMGGAVASRELLIEAVAPACDEKQVDLIVHKARRAGAAVRTVRSAGYRLEVSA